LAEEFIVDQAHGIFGESSSEAGESGMIGSGIIERKAQELFERCPVIDLGFQLRIGIDVKPLLKEQAFHKKDRRIGFFSPGAFADRITPHEEIFYSGPIDDGVDLFHSLDSSVLLNGCEKGYICEGEIGLHIFEAHSSSGA